MQSQKYSNIHREIKKQTEYCERAAEPLDCGFDGISSLMSSSQSQHQMQGRLLLDVVIGQSPAVLQLFSSKDQTLLFRRDSFFVLDLGLNILNRVIGLHVQCNGLSRQRFDENLHRSTSQSQHQMQGALLLDVVVAQRTAVLQLLSSKNQPLLLRRDTLLVLDLRLDILDRIIGFHIEGDGLSGQRLDKDLHGTTPQSQHQVQGRLLLDVVVRQSPAVLQLLSSKDQPLLLGWDPLFVLDLRLDVLNRVIGLHVQRDRLSRQRLHENLHRTTTQTQHQMESGLLLDIIVGQSP